MNQLLVTILVASFVVVTFLAVMGIGWLLTGRVRIVRGACGMDPKRLRDKTCGTKEIHCELCDKEKK